MSIKRRCRGGCSPEVGCTCAFTDCTEGYLCPHHFAKKTEYILVGFCPFTDGGSSPS